MLMGHDAPSPGALPEKVRQGFILCNYSAMAALAMTIYDMFLTSGDEVKRIWRRPWTHLKSLYVTLRVMTLIPQIISTYFYLRMSEYPSRAHCIFVLAFQSATAHAVMMCLQIILMLRVQALYNNNKTLVMALRGLFVAEVTTMAVMQGVAVPKITTGEFCVVLEFPTTAAAFLLLPIIFELILFVLGVAKFYQAVKDGWGKTSAMRRFMSDGVYAFVFPFACLLTNALCMLLIKSSASGVAYSWILPIAGICGYRLILNLSHLLKTAPNAGRTTDGGVLESNVEMTGNIMSADFEMDDISITESIHSKP